MTTPKIAIGTTDIRMMVKIRLFLFFRAISDTPSIPLYTFTLRPLPAKPFSALP